MQTINRTTQNWLKVENKEVVHEEFPHKLLVEPLIEPHKLLV